MDLTVSVIQQIAAVLMVVHLVTTVDQTASVFHAHQADALQTCKTIFKKVPKRIFNIIWFYNINNIVNQGIIVDQGDARLPQILVIAMLFGNVSLII